jgi:hypothetical protein
LHLSFPQSGQSWYRGLGVGQLVNSVFPQPAPRIVNIGAGEIQVVDLLNFCNLRTVSRDRIKLLIRANKLLSAARNRWKRRSTLGPDASFVSQATDFLAVDIKIRMKHHRPV